MWCFCLTSHAVTQQFVAELQTEIPYPIYRCGDFCCLALDLYREGSGLFDNSFLLFSFVLVFALSYCIIYNMFNRSVKLPDNYKKIMDKLKDKVIKDAQYRKGLSIAFFNATNNAVAFVQANPSNAKIHGDNETDEQFMERIVKVRNMFLDQHAEYYASVIANVGMNYNVDDAIKKLKATKDIEELSKVWVAFSEDERRNPEILKIMNETKTNHETIQ